MPDPDAKHPSRPDPDAGPPTNLAGCRLPGRYGAPVEGPELYRDGLEVLLPVGTTLTAMIPSEFDWRGSAIRWRRVEGTIVEFYTIEHPTEGGPAQAWYCVDASDGGGDGRLVQTRHIQSYTLPEEEEPYVPDVESAEEREAAITRDCFRPDPMEDYEPPFYYHPKA